MKSSKPNAERTILLVEDNPDILWANNALFAAQGYKTITAETIHEALDSLIETQPDVIVLDLMLPDGNALDYMPRIRAKTTAPILILTAMSEKDIRITSLRAGGDDYITKPYDIDELLARVEAFLRREAIYAKKTLADMFNLGPLQLDIIASQAYTNNTNMQLTPKEFSVLLLLAQNEDKPLQAETIYREAWKQQMAGDDSAVKIIISRLRKKLEPTDIAIITSRGEGYRLYRI